MKQETLGQTSVRLSKADYQELEEWCRYLGVSKATLTRMALNHYVRYLRKEATRDGGN